MDLTLRLQQLDSVLNSNSHGSSSINCSNNVSNHDSKDSCIKSLLSTPVPSYNSNSSVIKSILNSAPLSSSQDLSCIRSLLASSNNSNPVIRVSANKPVTTTVKAAADLDIIERQNASLQVKPFR